ncbi:hypothetical protein [Xanthobacter versatilis]
MNRHDIAAAAFPSTTRRGVAGFRWIVLGLIVLVYTLAGALRDAMAPRAG